MEGSEQTIGMVSPSSAKDETSCIVFLLSAGSPACFRETRQQSCRSITLTEPAATVLSGYRPAAKSTWPVRSAHLALESKIPIIHISHYTTHTGLSPIIRVPHYSVYSRLIPCSVYPIALSNLGQFLSPIFPMTLSAEG